MFKGFPLLLSALALVAHAEPPAPAPAAAEKPAGAATAEAPRTEFKLPGLVVNTVEKSVDVEAKICLVDGALEFIACTKDTKEHESIVVVSARPIHIHAALLLLGAKNGNPAMRVPIDKEGTRWADVPPKGSPVDVFLAWKDSDGKMVERPISDFIKRRDDDEMEVGAPASAPKAGAEKDKAEKFPNTFLFAGSLLGDPKETPRQYLAESSGHVISISTFGDEVLCLPDIHGQLNEALMWAVDSTHLPKLDTPVILRLRPKKQEGKIELKQAP